MLEGREEEREGRGEKGEVHPVMHSVLYCYGARYHYPDQGGFRRGQGGARHWNNHIPRTAKLIKVRR